MIFILVVAGALLAVIAWLSGVLVRRERRRSEVGADGIRIESAARSGIREARRRARAGRDMHTPSTDVFLRDR